MSDLRLNLSKYGRSDLLRLLDESGVQYCGRYPPSGTIMMMSDVIDIINATEPILELVAWVLVVWLGRNASRRLTVRTDDDRHILIESSAYTPAELEKARPTIESLLREAATVSAIQMKKDETNPTQ